jgi:hypothetical protein
MEIFIISIIIPHPTVHAQLKHLKLAPSLFLAADGKLRSSPSALSHLAVQQVPIEQQLFEQRYRISLIAFHFRVGQVCWNSPLNYVKMSWQTLKSFSRRIVNGSLGAPPQNINFRERRSLR